MVRHRRLDYLDALGARPYDDVVTQVPHAALRVFVMGHRGADREPATADDRARTAALAAAGRRPGALGFSTSRTINHKTIDGRHIPTLRTDENELAEIARALTKTGTGWLQVISDFDDPEEEMGMLRRLVERSGRSDIDYDPATRQGDLGRAGDRPYALLIMVTRGNKPEGNKSEDPGALKIYRFQAGRLTPHANLLVGGRGGLGYGPRHLDFSSDAAVALRLC